MWFEILVLLHCLHQFQSMIRWTDDPDDMDLFFDRIVVISYTDDNNFVNFASGVLIDEKHVLTSFNAFKNYSMNYNKSDITVDALKERIIKNGRLYFYTTVKRKVVCAKQVVLKRNHLKSYWVETDQAHNPLFDLMVMRVDDKFEFRDEKEIENAETVYRIAGSENKTDFRVAGPLLTKIAMKGAFLGKRVKFASLGFKDEIHVTLSMVLRHREFEPEENILDDCEEWLPPDWGYFICVKNVDNYIGIGSGAVLVYNSTVFGIGSFAFKVRDESILVFTDIRPYRDEILNTCV